MDAKLRDSMQYWQRHSPSWLFLGLGAGFGLGIVIGFLLGQQSRFGLESWFWNGFWPELLGMMVTITVIGSIQVYLSRAQYKKQLIRQARSRSNDIAIGAIEALNDEWDIKGENSPTKKISLSFANLQGLRMWAINFSESSLTLANLSHSDLGRTNFSNAHLRNTQLNNSDLGACNFRQSHLISANLRQSYLRGANFEQAELGDANLEGANLRHANLKDAELVIVFHVISDDDPVSRPVTCPVKLDANTILPNGEKWQPEAMDLTYLRDTYGCIVDWEIIHQNKVKRFDAELKAQGLK